MPYRPFALLTRHARGTELWRLALGLVFAVFVTFGLGQGLIALTAVALPPDAYWTFMIQLREGTTPLGMLAMLLNAGAMGIAALVTAQIVHRRAPLSLFGPRRLFLWQFYRTTVAIGLLYVVISILPPWPLSSGMTRSMPLMNWLGLLPLTLVTLLIQTAGEELLFRGYLQTQLAARLKHPAVWLILPSALFALGHWVPEIYGSNAGLVALWAFAFGAIASDLTARSGTLGPAIALHLVNNFVAIAIVSPQGQMSGLALFNLPFGPEDEAAVRSILPLDLATLFLGWLAARIALRV